MDSKKENGMPGVDESSRPDNDDVVKIVKKKPTPALSESDRFESPETFGGSSKLLSAMEFPDEVGGIKTFTQTNAKILEFVSHNNLLLLEKMKENSEDCSRQIKEKDDQIRYNHYICCINLHT